MLIGGGDISNDVITLGARFQCLFTFGVRFADWRKLDSSVDGEPQGNWRWNSNHRDVVRSSSFLAQPPDFPGELARRLTRSV